MSTNRKNRVPLLLSSSHRAALLIVALASGLVSLPGCGSGTNVQPQQNVPNRPPFIQDGTITQQPAVIGTFFPDDCVPGGVEIFRPAVEITYQVIDLEDLCGTAYFYYSDNGGLTYKLATESTFRQAGVGSPVCSSNPTTDMCAPCQPADPVGTSSAGAMVMEPDNHATPTCMNAMGGAYDRYEWDIIADGVGFPQAQQIVFCIVPTDPVNVMPNIVLSENNRILEGNSTSDQIDFATFRDNLITVPTNPGFFCTDTFSVQSPYTEVGINDADIREIRVGAGGRDFEVPVRIRNVNSGGPTCFRVGIQYDPSHINFRYFSGADFAMGIPPTSADLVRAAPLLSAVFGTVELVSPAPATMTGTEDFIVLEIVSPDPLVGGDLVDLLFHANPPPPSMGGGASALISLIETVPVGGSACEAAPATCPNRTDWQVAASDYTGVTNGGGGGDPCTGVDYPFVAEPPVAITCIENLAPECCIKDVEASDVRGNGLAVTYYLSDREGDLVFIAPEYTTDGGVTWSPMTERVSDPLTEGTTGLTSGLPAPCVAGSPTPCDIPACMGGDFDGADQHIFVWDIVIDLPPGTGFLCDAQIRIIPDDGATQNTMGCSQALPNLFQGPDLRVRRDADPTYLADIVISTQAGGSPIILPQLPASDDIRVFAVNLNGDEVDVTEAVTFVSSDPAVIDVTYDPVTGVAVVANDPGGLVPGTRARCDIGNSCVTIDVMFAGFTTPPLDTCPILFFDQGGAALTDLVTTFAACTDLGGPDYGGDRSAYMQLGDFDAEIPGLPSGPPIPGPGGVFDIVIWTDVENRDMGAYSVNLMWETAALTFEDIFRSPLMPSLTANTAMAFDSPVATLQWNNLTVGAGLRGVLELETIRFRVACPSGFCSTPFTLSIDTLVDQSAVDIGTFIGGNADSGTDCPAEFQVP